MTRGRRGGERTSRAKIFITGISGLLGGNLADAFRSCYEVAGIYHRHPIAIDGVAAWAGDILDAPAMIDCARTELPDIMIHCASLTSVDACQRDAAKSHAVNVVGTRNVAAAADTVGAKFVYISTDSVYDGLHGPHSETATPAPLNQYGTDKLAGEAEATMVPGALVLRTNIFGWNINDKQSLGEWVLDRLRSGQSFGGFKDALFSTIYTYELARVIHMAVQRDLAGVYNCGGRDVCSKLHFAELIADVFGLPKGGISPLSIDHAGLVAPRGKDLGLDVARIEEALGYRLPTIAQSVDRFYRDALSGLPERLRALRMIEPSPSAAIPYGRQWINAADREAVDRVLRSDFITQGPEAERFEHAVADYCGVAHAVAVNSGTAALHIACLAAGLGSDDELVTSPITFLASANCGVYCGARPIFADIDPETVNISPERLAEKMTPATRVVVPVHFAGQSCDMEAIARVVAEAENRFGRKIIVIEDASHALGSTFNGEPVGCCRYSDMAVTSFHPVKHITTGEGGMVLTNHDALNLRLRRLRTHGISHEPDRWVYEDQAFSGPSRVRNPWYYEQVALGFNYRITDIQCALGHAQLERLAGFVARRKAIVECYDATFAEAKNLQRPLEREPGSTNYHLYVLLADFPALGTTRAEAMAALMARGISTQVHYLPVHTQPYYQKNFGYRWGDFPSAEEYYRRCLTIPLFPRMSDADVRRVIDATSEVFRC